MFLQRIEQPQSSCSSIWGREKVKSSSSYPCACKDLCGDWGSDSCRGLSPRFGGSASGREWQAGSCAGMQNPTWPAAFWEFLLQPRHVSTVSFGTGCSFGEKAAGNLALTVSKEPWLSWSQSTALAQSCPLNASLIFLGWNEFSSSLVNSSFSSCQWVLMFSEWSGIFLLLFLSL